MEKKYAKIWTVLNMHTWNVPRPTLLISKYATEEILFTAFNKLHHWSAIIYWRISMVFAAAVPITAVMKETYVFVHYIVLCRMRRRF